MILKKSSPSPQNGRNRGRKETNILTLWDSWHREVSIN
jgi:hypothetical protein